MSMQAKFSDQESLEDNVSDSPTGGSNFLVSAILIMRRQRKEMQREMANLQERVKMLEMQNAAFMNVSADRLLKN